MSERVYVTMARGATYPIRDYFADNGFVFNRLLAAWIKEPAMTDDAREAMRKEILKLDVDGDIELRNVLKQFVPG